MSDTTMQISLGKAKVAEDLRTLLGDVEQLLRLTASASGEGVEALRERVQSHVETVKGKLVEAQGTAQSQCRVAAASANEYVNENPWRAVGIGVGVGIFLGVLAAR